MQSFAEKMTRATKYKDTKKTGSEHASLNGYEEREKEWKSDWKMDKDTEKKPWAKPYDETLNSAGSLHPPKYLASTWFSADDPDLAVLGQEHHKTLSSTTCSRNTLQQLVSFCVRLYGSPARRNAFFREPDYPCNWWKICHLWICKKSFVCWSNKFLIQNMSTDNNCNGEFLSVSKAVKHSDLIACTQLLLNLVLLWK